MDSGARIVTRGRETLDHGEWLQGRRHVIDTITGRSQHIPSRTTMKANHSLITYITMTSNFFVFTDRSSSYRLNGIYLPNSRCTGDSDERRQGGGRECTIGTRSKGRRDV
jgi:hypothetical protein